MGSLMKCRESCGACCIAPSIARPYYGMPGGKAAGERCAHLAADLSCQLFDDPRRPLFCSSFAAEPSVCGGSREQALKTLAELELLTLAPVTAIGDRA